MKIHLVEKSTRMASLFMMLFYILLVVLLAVFIYTLSGSVPSSICWVLEGQNT